MPAKLIVESEVEKTRQEIPFDKPQITLGRRSTNDLHFNRAEISGNHAAFVQENGEYYIMDVGSTNGTLLNGAQLVAREKYPLRDQDVITISPYKITFQAIRDIGATMMEEPAPIFEKLKGHAASATVYDVSGKLSTGTAEHEKDKVVPASGVEHQATSSTPPAAAAPKKAAAPKPAPAPPPPEPEPVPEEEALPAEPPAVAPEPVARPSVSKTPVAPAAAATNLPPAEVVSAPKSRAIGDYFWLAIGGIFVLLALGLTLMILFLL